MKAHPRKAHPCLMMASLALTPILMAAEPLIDADEIALAPKLDQLFEADAKRGPLMECGIIDTSVTHPPVKKLKEMAANEESIQSIINNDKAKETVDKLNAPIVIDSMEDALKHLTRASIEKIEVDFDKEQVAIFAWQGSERDLLSGELHTNHGVVAKILYSRRRTEGLKTHSVIFSMPKGAEIQVVELGARIKRCGPGEKNIEDPGVVQPAGPRPVPAPPAEPKPGPPAEPKPGPPAEPKPLKQVCG